MKKTPEDLVIDIQEACKELGWHIAMNESSPGVNGIVIGQFEYVEEVVTQLVDGDQYSIYSSGSETDVGLH